MSGFSPGDTVFGIGEASFAQYARATPAKIAPKPASLTFAQAATVPISGLTGLQAVRDHGRTQAGEQVLIIGASGGVGSFAVQLAKSLGAQVTAVCSTAKLDEVRPRRRPRHRLHPRGPHRRPAPLRGDPRHRRQPAALPATGRAGPARAAGHRGRETGGRWLGGTDRQIRGQVLSLFVRQQLGTFVTSEHARDLVTLPELLEAGKLAPRHRPGLSPRRRASGQPVHAG